MFHTPELLESILLQLDPHALLTSAQRICPARTSQIQKSTTIQRTLFFKPDQENSSAEKVHNVFLIEAFPYVFRMPGPASDDKQPSSRRSILTWLLMLVHQPPAYKIGVWMDHIGAVCLDTYYEVPVSFLLISNAMPFAIFSGVEYSRRTLAKRIMESAWKRFLRSFS